MFFENINVKWVFCFMKLLHFNKWTDEEVIIILLLLLLMRDSAIFCFLLHFFKNICTFLESLMYLAADLTEIYPLF